MIDSSFCSRKSRPRLMSSTERMRTALCSLIRLYHAANVTAASRSPSSTQAGSTPMAVIPLFRTNPLGLFLNNQVVHAIIYREGNNV